MKDELILVGDFDQDVSEGSREQELLKQVQDEIHLAADNHDIERAVKVCDYFQRAAKLSGKSLAHALYTMSRRWPDFGIGEEFIDYIFGRIGLHRHTVERYVKVAILLEETVPSQYSDQISSKGIQQLVPIANAVAQGYEIEPEVWEQLINATNYNEVREVINSATNRAPREGALSLRLQRTGTILAYRGDDSPKFIGSLEINDPDPSVQQAIERIVKNAGILQT
jgi:hypothetical protein